jgi:hypothetical protein
MVQIADLEVRQTHPEVVARLSQNVYTATRRGATPAKDKTAIRLRHSLRNAAPRLGAKATRLTQYSSHPFATSRNPVSSGDRAADYPVVASDRASDVDGLLLSLETS